MKLRLSRITIGFTLLGLAIALTLLGLGVAAAHSPGIQSWIDHSSAVILFICPGTIAGLGLAMNPTTQDMIEYCTIVVLSNTLLYFVIGLCVSFVLHKLLDRLDPPVMSR